MCSGLLTWVRNQTWALLYITVLTFIANQAFCPPPPPRARRIKLSRNHSPSPVSWLLIAICSGLRCILMYHFDSGQFCYCRYIYCAFICYNPSELYVLQTEYAASCSTASYSSSTPNVTVGSYCL